ncbi:Glucans biosynthesis protein G [Methylobacterium adhaesivum]|uniref:Glucan biosynthesis protein D n=1 Tax=Methylobacterium adhaesivum TaxID=333297 RepID=A0ABT8BH33_9HYPH|nr:glucan biosynthesis protein D [Methylobacterium adhaesivum]MDN3591178.1 glucan biosynthesis protein D [Methylobacterium adhaesivum]GJD32212.1 Glucans biosynthesis protein G [Methylobacterium adhaesivum]
MTPPFRDVPDAAAPTTEDPVTAEAGRHTRRDLIRGAGALTISAVLPGTALPGAALADDAPALPAAGTPFQAGLVTDLARALAARAYVAPRTDDLPGALADLNREQYAGIRTAPGSAVWAEAGLGFTLEPLHRGSVFRDRVALALVEDGVVRPLAYDRARFETDTVQIPTLKEDLGYSGFKIRARFDGGELSDFAYFQGASFYRLIATGQGFGVTARALTLRPADARGEEFPEFRAIWIERPGPGGPLVVHALVDSPSATAALRMSLRPGAASLCDVEGTVFARNAIDHLGLGGMTTSYLFGPYDRRGADDARAAVHSSGGLQIRTGASEAIWRPVRNPETLQVSSFMDDGPKGFGLMQRARDYRAFQDDVQHWEWRPSLWLEPLAPWGPGAVTLLEIPSDSEFNENILAYWRPKAGLAARAELAFSYRQHWCWQPPEPVPVAVVSGTRSGRGTTEARRLFLVDFTGEGLAEAGDLRTQLSVGPGAIVTSRLYRYPDRKTVRVAFELDPRGEKACELRLALLRDDTPLTETWLYRWTP